MLALLAWGGTAPAEYGPLAWTSGPLAEAGRDAPAGQPPGPSASHGLDWEEPGEEPLKLGRPFKAAPAVPPGSAPLHRADVSHDGIARSLPERPPRA